MRSKFEEKFAADLDSRDVYFEYENDRLSYPKANGIYTPDFNIVGRSQQFYVETKGLFSSADRTKMLAVKAAHPYADIRFVFQRAKNTLSKKSTTTYAMWAEQHGFAWAEKVVPDAWLV